MRFRDEAARIGFEDGEVLSSRSRLSIQLQPMASAAAKLVTVEVLGLFKRLGFSRNRETARSAASIMARRSRQPGTGTSEVAGGVVAQTLQVGLHERGIVTGERPKTRYRIRKWREYDRGLIAPGDLTVWLSPDLARDAAEGTGRQGRPPTFSDAAIQAVLTPKVL